MIEKKTEVHIDFDEEYIIDRFQFSQNKIIDLISKKIYNTRDEIDMQILCDDVNRILAENSDKITQRFILDDTGELIDLKHHKFIDYGEEVKDLLNDFYKQIQELKEL